jgi:dolichol-phosphate mannosyltransferase
MVYLLYILYAKFFLSTVIPGWSSVMSVVLLIGGVQMLLLGIIGIYISRIFWEIKSRPAYLIEQVIKC